MARWPDIAPWVGPTINEGDGDGRPGEAEDRLSDVRGLVLHIASGYFDGTIAWQRNKDANVSSHFIFGRDGRRAQMVDTADRAWTQRSGNGTWISVELEGFAPDDRLHAKHPGWERLTDAQIEACAQLLAKMHQVYGPAKVPLQLATSPAGRGLGHHSMGAESGHDWGHSQCPGAAIKAQKPVILARAKQIVAGTKPAQVAGVAPAGQEDDAMNALMRYSNDPTGAVFVTDGKAARWVKSQEELLDRQMLHNDGTLRLGYNGQVRVVGRRSLIGEIIGDVPPWWKDGAEGIPQPRTA